MASVRIDRQYLKDEIRRRSFNWSSLAATSQEIVESGKVAAIGFSRSVPRLFCKDSRGQDSMLQGIVDALNTRTPVNSLTTAHFIVEDLPRGVLHGYLSESGLQASEIADRITRTLKNGEEGRLNQERVQPQEQRPELNYVTAKRVSDAAENNIATIWLREAIIEAIEAIAAERGIAPLKREALVVTAEGVVKETDDGLDATSVDGSSVNVGESTPVLNDAVGAETKSETDSKGLAAITGDEPPDEPAQPGDVRIAPADQRKRWQRWLLATGVAVVAVLVVFFSRPEPQSPDITFQTITYVIGSRLQDQNQYREVPGDVAPAEISQDLAQRIREDNPRLDRLIAAVVSGNQENILDAAAGADPKVPTIFDALGSLIRARNLVVDEDYAAAEQILLDLLDHPDMTVRPTANRDWGNLLLKSNKPNLALRRFERATSDLQAVIENPTNSFQAQLAQFELAQLYLHTATVRTDNDLSKVKENFELCLNAAKAIRFDDQWIVKFGLRRVLMQELSLLFTELGIWFEKNGVIEPAIDSYQSSIARQAELAVEFQHAQPFGNLAWIYVDLEGFRNHREAVDLASLAIEIADVASNKRRHVHVPRYLDTLATAYEGLGKTAEAVKARTRSVAFETSPDIDYLKSMLEKARTHHNLQTE